MGVVRESRSLARLRPLSRPSLFQTGQQWTRTWVCDARVKIFEIHILMDAIGRRSRHARLAKRRYGDDIGLRLGPSSGPLPPGASTHQLSWAVHELKDQHRGGHWPILELYLPYHPVRVGWWRCGTGSARQCRLAGRIAAASPRNSSSTRTSAASAEAGSGHRRDRPPRRTRMM